MSGRHARTPEPPSTSGTFRERAARRSPRIALLMAAAAALVVPVAADAMASPAPIEHAQLDASVSEVRDASTKLVSKRLAAPGEGPINTVGFAAVLAGTQSSDRVEASSTYLSNSMIAEREAAVRAAAEKAEQERRAAEQAAREQAAREQAARDQAAAEEQAAAAPAVASGSVWDSLAQCEAGGNWAINTGNGYYGGLQFSLSSWRGVGGTGYPHEASRETQIAMGERLKAQGGWGHWPACSRKLGLR